MKNLKKYYIRNIFENSSKLKKKGIFLSGIKGEGEYKEWYESGKKLYIYCIYKNGEICGEFKKWVGPKEEHSFHTHPVKLQPRDIDENGAIIVHLERPENMKYTREHYPEGPWLGEKV